jgi:hypothetical protein
MQIDAQGGGRFFGEPMLDSNDLLASGGGKARGAGTPQPAQIPPYHSYPWSSQ